jgi:tuftelin-interacting protein 11
VGFGKRSAFSGSSSKQKTRAGFGSAGPNLAEIDSDIAGMRRKGFDVASKSLIQKGVGNWERHTKGIGAKLLLQVINY